MSQLEGKLGLDENIKASWERCERQHRLVRSTAKPVLRLLSSEVAPRLDEVVERTGGRLGIFSELAKLGTDAGHCLVVTDPDGVVVRFESRRQAKDAFEQNGIGLGSCWDERIAGTNGVSMAMLSGDAFTVRGDQHFHRSLSPFACTAVPLLDADNATLGAVSFSVFDQASLSDYLIAKKLLLTAAGKVQRRLFETKYADCTILAVSSANHGDLLRRKGLVAVDDNGVVLGATKVASDLAEIGSVGGLIGQSVESVLGTDVKTLHAALGNVHYVKAEGHAHLTLSISVQNASSGRSSAPRPFQSKQHVLNARRRLAPQLRDLACGSQLMAASCRRIEAHVRRAHPVVIEGESGTGKSALVNALCGALGLSSDQVTTVDCSALHDSEQHREYLQNLFDQARAIQALGCEDQGTTILVLDNIDEMPAYAQSGLRNLLDHVERDAASLDSRTSEAGLRVVAISRKKLVDAVHAGQFRDDLFYLLSGATIELPALRQREDIGKLAHFVGSQIAAREISISPEALASLKAHDWPGNVRELRNVLQQALMEGNGTHVSPVELKSTSAFEAGSLRTPPPNRGPSARPNPVYDEKTMLLDALIGTHWNVSKAARNLGMGRATINRKIRQHGLSRPT